MCWLSAIDSECGEFTTGGILENVLLNVDPWAERAATFFKFQEEVNIQNWVFLNN